ncbi:MAG: hypothetical protein Q9214_002374 [Letrouitia sp. 1 TL-2023]
MTQDTVNEIPTVAAARSSSTKAPQDNPKVRNGTAIFQSPSTLRASQRNSTSTSLPIILSPSAGASCRQQLFSLFLDCYFPRDILEEQKPWFAQLSELSSPTKAVEFSTMAVCSAKLGRLNDDKNLTQESLSLYAQGLKELQKELWNRKLMHSDETLAACMALGMYELMECPAGDRHGYISHQNGCARMIQLRGAKAYQTGLSHKIFQTFRLQNTLQSLEQHHSTYLTDPCWATVPFEESGKDLWNQVLDYVAQAPRILGQIDKFKDIPIIARLPLTLEIIDECWKIDTELEKLESRFKANVEKPPYTTEVSKMAERFPSNLTLGNAFSTGFHFPNLRMASTMVLYWAVLLMLWTGLSALYTQVTIIKMMDPSAVSVEFPPLGHRTGFIAVARNILQSFEYCMQDSMREMGPSTIAAPLDIVVETLKDYPQYSQEVAWAKEALGIISQRSMRYLKTSKK